MSLQEALTLPRHLFYFFKACHIFRRAFVGAYLSTEWGACGNRLQLSLLSSRCGPNSADFTHVEGRSLFLSGRAWHHSAHKGKGGSAGAAWLKEREGGRGMISLLVPSPIGYWGRN